MTDYKMLMAGFGGQGILFLGKVAANAGLYDGKEVSWLPSYGPEMRGGTANCSVCISDEPIGCPLVSAPNVFVAMNLPSYQRFIDAAVPGAQVFLDSSLIHEKTARKDVSVFYLPATGLAEENGLKGLANIILLGKVLKETGFCSYESLETGIEHSVPASKKHLVESNLKAVALGMEYSE